MPPIDRFLVWFQGLFSSGRDSMLVEFFFWPARVFRLSKNNTFHNFANFWFVLSWDGLRMTPGWSTRCWFRSCLDWFSNQQVKEWGSACSTAVVHTPHDREVVGLNPAGSWAFFSSLSYQLCILNQVPHRRGTLLILSRKIYSALQLEAQDWANKK